MERQGFVEVETPMLMPSTPEGAREFLVPSRQVPGSFYALPQSPQLFKQLLMVGGTDRYYQIARCLRDEDLRADRQYEFMQLDAEASFVTQDEVLAFVSEAVLDAAEAVTGERPGHDPADDLARRHGPLRHRQARPALRHGAVELTPVFAATEFKAFASAGAIKGLRVAGASGDYGRNKLDALTDRAKALGAKGLVWMRVGEGGALDSPVAKFLSRGRAGGAGGGPRRGAGRPAAARGRRVAHHLRGAGHAAQRPRPAAGARGAVPLRVGRRLPDVRRACRRRAPPSRLTTRSPGRTPTTSTSSSPTRCRCGRKAYDLVLNGWELGSGSIRIHEPELQQRIFDLLGIGEEEAERRFGFFLTPFRYGAPPHGGFAFGIDRLVAILAGEENIREVIAFPKPQSGVDPMTQAPTPVDDEQLRELGLRRLPPKT